MVVSIGDLATCVAIGIVIALLVRDVIEIIQRKDE